LVLGVRQRLLGFVVDLYEKTVGPGGHCRSGEGGYEFGPSRGFISRPARNLHGVRYVNRYGITPALKFRDGAKVENKVQLTPIGMGDIDHRRALELLIAAEAFKAAVELVKPHLAEAMQSKGTVVLGTVEGDIHDIGKNIVALTLETNGYEVVDIGIDVPIARFAEEQARTGAQIVGASAMITSTLPALKRVVEDVRAKSPETKVLIGGAPVTPELVAVYGADRYAGDAIEAVRVADELLAW
jgi:5-methyltetrahydrofolate--homocysteine methyltransferase